MSILTLLFLICIAVAFVAFLIWIYTPKRLTSDSTIPASLSSNDVNVAPTESASIISNDVCAAILEMKLWVRFFGIITIIGIVVGVIVALI